MHIQGEVVRAVRIIAGLLHPEMDPSRRVADPDPAYKPGSGSKSNFFSLYIYNINLGNDFKYTL